MIDLISTRSTIVKNKRSTPSFFESIESLSAALGTGPVPRREGNRFIQEKKLSVPVRGHDRSFYVFELQQANEPSSIHILTNNLPVFVMKRAASVAHEGPTSSARENHTPRINSVL
jgi:hypothetical protein